MEKKIFVAATRQNDGKTVVSIGLMLALINRFNNVGFIKPVGQKYRIVDNRKIDKDAVLMHRCCSIKGDIKDMNPIAVEEGFTRKYLTEPSYEELHRKIVDGYKNLARDKDFVVIEGTGHAGVGSVFDMCNAEVARILDAPVIIISVGGIGKPLDEIALNLSLFREKGVKIKGVIINKIIPEKKVDIERYLKIGCERMGVDFLGTLPYMSLLSQPDLFQICNCVNGKVISGFDKMFQKIQNVIVGAMTARHALDYFKPDSLLVTPGDREDMILAAITRHALQEIRGLVLTGGLYPHKTILELIKEFEIPTVITSLGTYETASRINSLVVKVTEKDLDKIEAAKKLVEENIDIEKLIK